MEERQIYQRREQDPFLPVCEDTSKYTLEVAAPILAEGDVLGSVIFASVGGGPTTSDTEYKLVQAVSGFLGRHMES